MRPYKARKISLSCGALLDGSDLSEHHDGVALHNGDAAETLAVLERVDDERLLRLEHDLRDLVGLEHRRVLLFRATGLLANFPVDLRHLDGRAARADEADRRVADLELSGVVQNLDLHNVERKGNRVNKRTKPKQTHLHSERLGAADRVVLGQNHDVADARHVRLVEALDVHADVVAGTGDRDGLVVHLDGEHLAGARRGRRVRRQEDKRFE
jgi:hypothetical protein